MGGDVGWGGGGGGGWGGGGGGGVIGNSYVSLGERRNFLLYSLTVSLLVYQLRGRLVLRTSYSI